MRLFLSTSLAGPFDSFASGHPDSSGVHDECAQYAGYGIYATPVMRAGGNSENNAVLSILTPTEQGPRPILGGRAKQQGEAMYYGRIARKAVTVSISFTQLEHFRPALNHKQVYGIEFL